MAGREGLDHVRIAWSGFPRTAPTRDGSPFGASPDSTGIRGLRLGNKESMDETTVEEAGTQNLKYLRRGRVIGVRESHPDLSQLRLQREYPAQSLGCSS